MSPSSRRSQGQTPTSTPAADGPRRCSSLPAVDGAWATLSGCLADADLPAENVVNFRRLRATLDETQNASMRPDWPIVPKVDPFLVARSGRSAWPGRLGGGR
jgi:hypothetical protein